MKKLHILSLAVAAALASGLALAQTAAPRPQMKLDANGDGVVTKAEVAKFPKLAERFDQMDKNKDGKLSRDELPKPRGGMRGHDGRDRGGMRGLDANHDGRISRAEMQAGQAKWAERFDRMDVNKDGYLDRADMQARMASRRAECFAKADTDKNGQLSRVEFDKMGEACGRPQGRVSRMAHEGPHPGPMPPKPPVPPKR